VNIAILGSGAVAQTITPMLATAGHRVSIGSRTPSAAAPELAASAAQVVLSEQAVTASDVVINAVPGHLAIDFLKTLSGALDGKILMDVSNAVTFADDGFSLVFPNGSLGEAIQSALPNVHVVKAMNSMSAAVIADPSALSGPVSVFVSGDDAEAKSCVTDVLKDLGWPAADILDLGGIATARGPEHVFLLLAALFGALGSPHVGLAVVQ
jgi:predicted dinucleotide-binding enzyme